MDGGWPGTESRPLIVDYRIIRERVFGVNGWPELDLLSLNNHCLRSTRH